MIGFQIHDIKLFMSGLLVQEIFDNFLVKEVDIVTFNRFTIDGYVNKEWYNSEEQEQIENRMYSKWKEVKPIALSLIKGNKTPSSFHMVFLASENEKNRLLSSGNIGMSPEDVAALFINIRFERGELSVVTGTSLKVFSLDKAVDRLWDERIRAFFSSQKIAFEIV